MHRSRIRACIRGCLLSAGVAGMLLLGGGLLQAVERAQNPKVQPGNVNWHADFDAACAAAAKSGRPVLLFQMMGNLDEAFT